MIMLNTRIHGSNYSSSEPLNPLRSSVSKPLRKAYFIKSASPINLFRQTKDNEALIRKYYPKKITFLASGPKKLPNYLATCTKGLRHLQAQYPREAKGFSRSLTKLELFKNYYDSKPDPFQFRRTILSNKRVHTLNLRGRFTGEPFKDIIYLRKLQVLNIDLKANQLQDITKSVMSLELLTILKVFIAKVNSNDSLVLEQIHFLDFCEKTLKKPSLKAFKLVFETNTSPYSTETFEKMLEYVEKSNIERWDIQVMLAEDQALRIAQKFSIFKQVEKLGVYSWLERWYTCGLTPFYMASDVSLELPENPDKSLTIFLTKGPEQIENYEFDLTSLLRECPKLECLFIDWEYQLLSQTSISEKFIGYQYLKSIYFTTDVCSKSENWLTLLQVLEDTPFLERFYISMLDMEMKLSHEDATSNKPFYSIQAVAERLCKIKTLKALQLRSSEQSQTSLDALQNLFDTLHDIEELTIDIDFKQNLNMPIIPFDKMTKLTQLRVDLSASIVIHLSSLIASVSQLSNLKLLEFRDKRYPSPSMWSGKKKGESISFDSVLSLMDNLKNLTKLQKFTLVIELNPPDGQNSTPVENSFFAFGSTPSLGHNPPGKTSLFGSESFFGQYPPEKASLFGSNSNFQQNASTQDTDIVEKVELVKQEVKKLTSRCQELESVLISFTKKASIYTSK